MRIIRLSKRARRRLSSRRKRIRIEILEEQLKDRNTRIAELEAKRRNDE